MQFGGIAHNPVVIYGGHHTRGFQGIMNRAFNAWQGNVNYQNQSGGLGPNPFGPADHAYWGITHDFCSLPRCNTSSGEEMNYAMFGLQTQNAWGCCGVQTFPEKGTTTMAWSNVYLGDRQRPWLESPPGNRGWHDDGFATHPLTVRARDNGLGIYAIRMSGAASGSATRYHGCTGHPDGAACPWDWSAGFNYTLNEGRNTLTVDARDAVDNYTPTHTWTLDVDRSPPQITQLSGSLYDARNRDDDHRGEGVYDATAALSVRASDAHAGVREIEVYVDGQSQRTRGGYAASGALDWTFNADDYLDGTHSVDVVVRDHVAGQPGAPENRHVTTRSFAVTVDRDGDVYRATQHEGQDTSPGQQTAEEWARLETLTSRSVDADTIGTRRREACDESSEEQCDVVRWRTRVGERDSGAADPYEVYRGPAGDPNVPNIAEILEARHRDEDPVATGSLRDVTRPWQTLPPARGTQFERYDWTAEHDSTPEAEQPPDEETDPADARQPQSVELTRHVYVERVTKLPVREIVVEADGTRVGDVMYSYDRERMEASALAGDFFAVGAPANEGKRSESDVHAGGQPDQTDAQTNRSYTPYWFGTAPAITGVGNFCLAVNETLRFTPAAPEDGDIPDVDADPEAPALPYAVDTSVVSSYSVGSGSGCSPTRLEGAADLAVVSYHRESTAAQAWRTVYEEDASEMVVDPLDPDFSRDGAQPLLFGTTPVVAQVVVVDDESTAALFDVGDTMLIVTGPFEKDELQLVVNALEAQS